MKNVIVVCEDLFGLEVYSILNEINAYIASEKINMEGYNILGFVCDNPNVFDAYNISKPVLCSIKDWQPEPNVFCIMGIKEPEAKERVATEIKCKGGNFLTVITPWTIMPDELNIGEGCVISSYSFKRGSVFGDFVTLINVMSEASKVGDYSTVDALTNVTNSTIGKKVYVGPHSFIFVDKTIGDGSRIFPGSMVYSNLKLGSKVAGIPARGVMYKHIMEGKL